MGNSLTTAGNVLDSAGKAQATVSLFCAIIFTLILFCTASYFIYNNHDSNYQPIKGLISKSICNKSSTDFHCTVTIGYEYLNENKTVTLLASRDTPYIKGETIDIYINKYNPNDISIDKPSNFIIGVIFCVVGIVLILIAGGNYYLTYNSKLYSELQGAELGVRSVESIFT